MIHVIEAHCTKILSTTCNQLPFHNLVHTREVVQNVRHISQALKMSEEESAPIVIAAWFHDTGFCETYTGHETVSIELAADFLKKRDYPIEKLQLVIDCIEATKMPQRPKHIYAEVLSDADIFHISTPFFFYRKLLLRREWELFLNQFSTDLEWHYLNLHFLEMHKFFTPYGKEVLMKGQNQNEEKVRTLISLYE